MMTLVPRVSELTRERICREFDDLGPRACLAEITGVLADENPEILDMMARCAEDIGATRPSVMTGLAMFYRLLVAEARLAEGLALPRVTAETRAVIVDEIAQRGEDQFTLAACDQLQKENPELLQMAEGYASRHPDYLAVMQGFCLVYRTLSVQSKLERGSVH
jgi:hypothetical protein